MRPRRLYKTRIKKVITLVLPVGLRPIAVTVNSENALILNITVSGWEKPHGKAWKLYVRDREPAGPSPLIKLKGKVGGLRVWAHAPPDKPTG
jgi:hypothetical protein